MLEEPDLKPTNDPDITTDESEDELHIHSTKSLLKTGRKSKYKPEHTREYQLDKPNPSVRASIYHVFTYSYLNILLVFVPCGLIVSAMRLHNQTIIFALNAIAIIPVTGLLTYATEELAQRMGIGLGALLNIVFGNLVELVILISMLGKTHFSLVKSSLLGSIFVNLLFILGVALIFAGWNREELVFDRKRTQLLMLFVMTSILCLLVPSSLKTAIKDENLAKEAVLKFSRGLSFALLAAYALFLRFQTKLQELPARNKINDMEMFAVGSDEEDDYLIAKPQTSRRVSATPTLINTETAPMHKAVALGTLLVSAFVVSLSAEATVSSLTHVISNTPLSTTFLSLILLPLLGNSAELGTAVTVARKGNVDLAINVAVGSAIQVASGMTPIMILLGWFMGKEVGLSLTGFELAGLLISVVIVGASMIGGKTTWMLGGLLCIVYGVIGIGAYFVPNEA